ncbi:MAG: glycoside hydrolase family 16 protein [Acidobacteriia bacterium]|nr:glycoside hydrolase family 16 protein [Terriglobia bacterium]
MLGTRGGNAAGLPPNPPADRRPWALVWSDEFDATNGSLPDPTKWTFDIGGGGWGNSELETYTGRPENAYLQDGLLVIQVRKESYTGPDKITRGYTSARLKTQGLYQWTHGRVEARMKLPYGQGLWPAFWMLGSDFGQIGSPACGEIDIMENIGREPSIVHGTIHGPGYSGDDGITSSYALPGGQRFADDFHVFAIEWEAKFIRFYVDGKLYATRRPSDLPSGANWVFNKPFFIILNVAVGGEWPGDPDSTTIFPQTMLVDYVRVYQRGGS